MNDDSERLQMIIHGVTAFALLCAGLEFGLFDKIEAAKGMELFAVADELGVDKQSARVLLLGLSSLRLIRRENGKYVNAEVTKRNLLRSSPAFLGALVDVQEKIINRGIGDLAASVRSGTNVGLRHFKGTGSTIYQRLAEDPALQEVYYQNMGDTSRKMLHLVATFDFSMLNHVVDLGGGDGSNAIELALRYPNLKITVFDHETVTEIAARNIKKAGLESRVGVCPGDFFGTPFPDGIDGILYCHLFEIWSIERNIKLLRRCYEALPSRGRVLVYNFVSNEDNTGSMLAAFMSAYFLALASGEGMVYAASNVEAAMRSAGFASIERFDGLGFDHPLFVGVKQPL